MDKRLYSPVNRSADFADEESMCAEDLERRGLLQLESKRWVMIVPPSSDPSAANALVQLSVTVLARMFVVDPGWQEKCALDARKHAEARAEVDAARSLIAQRSAAEASYFASRVPTRVGATASAEDLLMCICCSAAQDLDRRYRRDCARHTGPGSAGDGNAVESSLVVDAGGVGRRAAGVVGRVGGTAEALKAIAYAAYEALTLSTTTTTTTTTTRHPTSDSEKGTKGDDGKSGARGSSNARRERENLHIVIISLAQRYGVDIRSPTMPSAVTRVVAALGCGAHTELLGSDRAQRVAMPLQLFACSLGSQLSQPMDDTAASLAWSSELELRAETFDSALSVASAASADELRALGPAARLGRACRSSGFAARSWCVATGALLAAASSAAARRLGMRWGGAAPAAT